MDSGRNFKITRAILVMTAILMSVVLGSVGVSHNQNPSTDNEPETVAQLSKQPASGTQNQPDVQPQNISVSLAAAQPRAEKLATDAVHKSGTLTQDETWTSDHTYVTDDPVTVPEGKTLTITEGTVVKNTKAGGIIVEPGGTLNILGDSDASVTITSTNDSTVGSDPQVGASNGAPSDYGTAVHAKADSSVNVQHARVAYASTAFVLEASANITDATINFSQTAFHVSGGEVKLAGISIDSVTSGITTTSGVVTFAGSMTNVTNKNIEACSWGTEGCSVNATYTNLSPEMLAAVPACGQVTLASTLGALIDGMLQPANCDSTTTLLEPANPVI